MTYTYTCGRGSPHKKARETDFSTRRPASLLPCRRSLLFGSRPLALSFCGCWLLGQNKRSIPRPSLTQGLHRLCLIGKLLPQVQSVYLLTVRTPCVAPSDCGGGLSFLRRRCGERANERTIWNAQERKTATERGRRRNWGNRDRNRLADGPTPDGTGALHMDQQHPTWRFRQRRRPRPQRRQSIVLFGVSIECPFWRFAFGVSLLTFRFWRLDCCSGILSSL